MARQRIPERFQVWINARKRRSEGDGGMLNKDHDVAAST